MKTKLMMMGALAAACAAHELAAMPTEEETRRAEPVVQKLLASERAALKSGKKTRSEVAVEAMKLADKAEADAEKLLLMKGAFVLYAQDGNIDKAAETMKALKAMIPDLPSQSVKNMIEAALLGVSKKEDSALLYKLFDESKGYVKCDMSPSMAGEGGKDLYMIVDLTKTGKSAISYLRDVPKNGWSDEYRTKKMVLRKIAPGSFEYMPGKSFKITKPFYIGVFEVTQKQYEMVMKGNPSEFKGDMRPVERVSYADIRGSNKGLGWPKDNLVDDDSYLGKLRKGIGLEFDLPTEVQLEYACRADTTGKFNVDGVDIVKLGKCADNGGRNDHHVKVGSFLPNAWGLYDMYGNVWEWCLDRGPDGYTWMRWTADAKETDTDPKGPAVGASRLHHGGGWHDDASVCHSGRRPCIPASVGNSLIGLRLACPADGRSMKLSTDEKPSELKTERAEQKKNYGGYTWSYRVKNDEATLMAEKDGKPVCAVSPTPTGDVTIPPTLNYIKVTKIGQSAFKYCKELTSVTIPEGVTYLDTWAFDSCGGLKSVTLPSSLKEIGYAAFGKCMALKSVTIPNGVKSIRADAFNGCGLKSVVLPGSVTGIGDRAFCGCRELESVAIPAGVARMGKGVFAECNALKIINVDSGNQSFTSIDGVLYTKDRSELVMYPNPPASVVIPKGVTKIRGWAFAGGKEMTSVTIPEGVTNIGDVAFLDCVGLKSVTIPSSVKKIEEHAFERCGELTEVTMLGERPEAANEIFKKCGKLKAIHVPANAKSWAGMKEWQGIPLVFDGDDVIRKREQEAQSAMESERQAEAKRAGLRRPELLGGRGLRARRVAREAEGKRLEQQTAEERAEAEAERAEQRRQLEALQEELRKAREEKEKAEGFR